jgi:hypothetical protein
MITTGRLETAVGTEKSFQKSTMGVSPMVQVFLHISDFRLISICNNEKQVRVYPHHGRDAHATFFKARSWPAENS